MSFTTVIISKTRLWRPLNRRIYSECAGRWCWWNETRRLSLLNRTSDSRECSIGLATQAINHRHYPIVASESREKGDAADEGINDAVDARMSYPWSRHVASTNGLAPVENVNGRFINSHRIANDRIYKSVWREKNPRIKGNRNIANI